MCFCGGDFQPCLKAAEDDSTDKESWAYPFPREELPEHFAFCIDQLTAQEKNDLWDSARNARYGVRAGSDLHRYIGWIYYI